jgi:hypothetical protein
MLARLLKGMLAPARAPKADRARRDAAAEHYETAVEHARAGRLGEAAAACRAALGCEPNFTAAYLLLAEIALPGENYFQLLGRIHAHLRPRTYVEIGVAQGDSLRLVGPGTRVLAVDPEPRIPFELPPSVRVFAQTSDEFFASHDVRAELGGLPVDLAFIDGMHHFDFALRDFVNLEALCAPESTILIHDVYPLDERTAARERVTDFWSGDIWRLVLLLRAHRPDLAIHTVGTPPTGLAVVRNLDPQSRYLRERLDELVEEYLAVDFAVLGGVKADRLALMPNDWAAVRSVLDAPPRR